MSVCHLKVETSIQMKYVEPLCWIKATVVCFFLEFQWVLCQNQCTMVEYAGICLTVCPQWN